MATQLPIYTQIHSRYQVFDASGRLPFSIVFGFCRRSSIDTDTRALVLDVSSSVMDVPYALANGLLTLHERDPKDIHHYIDVDIGSLDKTPTKDAGFLSLSSPVNRTENWRDSFSTYLYPVDAHSELASILKPGKKYSIRLASKDLGVKWWAYDGREEPLGESGDEKMHQDPEDAKLVNSKATGGNATFSVVQSLPWPPQIETKMRLAPTLLDESPVARHLWISVTNVGDRPVTVQTRNDQSFLIPWGPMQPVTDALSDSLLRVIDAYPHKPPTSSLQVFHVETGQVANDNTRHGVCSLKDSTSQRRPKTEWLVTLKPGEPLVRQVSIDHLLRGLEDGLYQVKMNPRGCWWHDGQVTADEDGRVPQELYKTKVPPLMLESEDVVKFMVQDGKCCW